MTTLESPHRRTARLAGLLYLATFVTSIPAFALKAPILDNPGAAHPNAALAAASAALEILLAAACVGTAVALYPVLRRRAEGLALGFIAARLIEAGLIAVGILAVLTLAHPDRNTEAADMFVDLHNWAFLLGPGLIPAVNAFCLAPALRRGSLVPRALTSLGLVGAPLLLLSASGTLFGLSPQDAPLAAALALPIAAWELLLGLRLTFRGFDHPATTPTT